MRIRAHLCAVHAHLYAGARTNPKTWTGGATWTAHGPIDCAQTNPKPWMDSTQTAHRCARLKIRLVLPPIRFQLIHFRCRLSTCTAPQPTLLRVRLDNITLSRMRASDSNSILSQSNHLGLVCRLAQQQAGSPRYVYMLHVA